MTVASSVPMKTITHCLRAGMFGLLLNAASIAYGQSTTTTTTSTTSSDGTIGDLSPSVITVRSTSSTTPVSYSYSKTTTYVDESGNPVSMETVHSGAPVTVYYSDDGGQMMATKVVVHKVTTTTDAVPDTAPDATTTTVKKTSTTTTTSTGEQ
jgi:hypothetical protein